MTARRDDSSYTNLCQYQYADGRLCSMPGVPSLNGFCRSHAALNRPRPPVEEDLSSELSQFYSPADGHLDVHRALERVFKAMAANRISTRRAATFGYLGQLILLSKPGKEAEELNKRELHDLYNICSATIRATYSPHRRSSAPAATPTQSPKPAAVTSSTTDQNHGRSQ